jgi:hypothetical protein
MADTVEAQCREAVSAYAFARAWDEGLALDAAAAADWGTPSLGGGEASWSQVTPRAAHAPAVTVMFSLRELSRQSSRRRSW